MVFLFSSKYQLRSKTISKVNVEFDLFSHGQMDRDRQINVWTDGQMDRPRNR